MPRIGQLRQSAVELSRPRGPGLGTLNVSRFSGGEAIPAYPKLQVLLNIKPVAGNRAGEGESPPSASHAKASPFSSIDNAEGTGLAKPVNRRAEPTRDCRCGGNYGRHIIADNPRERP